jgi:hypothetical protein
VAYAPPGGFVQRPRTNGLAITSMIFGIVGILLGPGGPIASIPALIMAPLALRKIRDQGEGGRGLAIAGVILGVVGLILAAFWIALIVYLANKVHQVDNNLNNLNQINGQLGQLGN